MPSGMIIIIGMRVTMEKYCGNHSVDSADGVYFDRSILPCCLVTPEVGWKLWFWWTISPYRWHASVCCRNKSDKAPWPHPAWEPVAGIQIINFCKQAVISSFSHIIWLLILVAQIDRVKSRFERVIWTSLCVLKFSRLLSTGLLFSHMFSSTCSIQN